MQHYTLGVDQVFEVFSCTTSTLLVTHTLFDHYPHCLRTTVTFEVFIVHPTAAETAALP